MAEDECTTATTVSPAATCRTNGHGNVHSPIPNRGNGGRGTAGTAATHAVVRVPTGVPDDTVASTLVRVRSMRYDAADAVYVLDEARRLVGLVPISEFLTAPPERTLGQIMLRDPPAIAATADQERVVQLAAAHGLSSVPVVEDTGLFVGVVSGPTLVEILGHEHAEDLHRLAGIAAPDGRAHKALEGAIVSRARLRLPWLLLGLVGSAAATAVMVCFERALERNLVVAFFIPAIVYLADAIGTQTESIAVRYLSVEHKPLPRLLGGELATGALIGLCLAAVILPAVLLGFGNVRLAIAVSVAVLAASACAAVLGLLFPWLLSWAGKDPAFGSGPVATIIQDVLSLLIYFALVILLLR